MRGGLCQRPCSTSIVYGGERKGRLCATRSPAGKRKKWPGCYPLRGEKKKQQNNWGFRRSGVKAKETDHLRKKKNKKYPSLMLYAFNKKKDKLWRGGE